MADYQIHFHIDIEADNHREAAQETAQVLLDQLLLRNNAFPPIFKVVGPDAKTGNLTVKNIEATAVLAHDTSKDASAAGLPVVGLSLKFEDLGIGAPFSTKEARWVKVSESEAVCLKSNVVQKGFIWNLSDT